MGWVQARWEATPHRMFQRLREAVKADFDAFQALTSEDGKLRRSQFHWRVSDSGDIFAVVDNGDTILQEVVRFCLDRAEGIIAIEWWKIPQPGGGGMRENRWLSRPTTDGGPEPRFDVDPENDKTVEPFRATPEELSRRCLLDFFAGWE